MILFATLPPITTLFDSVVEKVENEFKSVNIDVDVIFKLLIYSVELVDNEFKLLNNVVDVACKFPIFNLEYVDIELN
jgi:hypothetical protein